MIHGMKAASGAALMFAALVSSAVSAAVPPEGGVLSPEIEIDSPVISADSDAAVYVLVRFAVPETGPAAEADRPSLNLALVLDRSGSMESKGKLEYLKTAAKMVVDSLNPGDRLAIVEYDDRVTVMWPSSPVEAKSMMKRLIDGLHPRGATDLSGGMVRGVEEVRQYLREERVGQERVTRVLLLSDGLANRGITDPRAIRRLVREARHGGARITALGLGLDYNEDLMQDIARYGGGNYYYIENPRQMAGIFGREMRMLFRTAARDVTLHFEPGKAVRSVEVFGYEAETAIGETVVRLEDFYAGEERSLLLRLDVAAGDPGALGLGSLRLDYLDVAAEQRQTVTSPLSVRVSSDGTEVDEARNGEVEVEVALVEAERRHAEAVQLLQSGQHDAARQQLQTLAEDLERQNNRLNDPRLAAKVEALEVEQKDVAEIAAAPPAAAMDLASGFMKSSKQRLYQAGKGQRGGYLLREGDAGFEVEDLQQALTRSGHYAGPVDGDFGPELKRAVEAYQKENGLAIDGVAGPATLRQLGLY